jgi:hypothetical protein
VAAAPALPLLEIITEPLVAPAPRRVDVLAPRMARLAIPRPAVAAPLPTPMPSVVERALEAAAWQDAPPVEAPTPRPAPPRGFEILAVERVVAAPPPRAIVEAPPPAPAPGPEPEVAVRVEIQGPEPEPEAPSVVEIETAAAPEPQPLAPRIPDLDGRIDALLRAREGAPRRRRRSPLDVPRFAPLRRDAWEDRLDAVLSR